MSNAEQNENTPHVFCSSVSLVAWRTGNPGKEPQQMDDILCGCIHGCGGVVTKGVSVLPLLSEGFLQRQYGVCV